MATTNLVNNEIFASIKAFSAGELKTNKLAENAARHCISAGISLDAFTATTAKNAGLTEEYNELVRAVQAGFPNATLKLFGMKKKDLTALQYEVKRGADTQIPQRLKRIAQAICKLEGLDGFGYKTPETKAKEKAVKEAEKTQQSNAKCKELIKVLEVKAMVHKNEEPAYNVSTVLALLTQLEDALNK